ncbi:MAG TPA: hypothetical protein VI365_25485 [Trebonia sp.]
MEAVRRAGPHARPRSGQTSPSPCAACPQTGFCTLAYSLSGAAELVTEATGATVTLKASAPKVTGQEGD